MVLVESRKQSMAVVPVWSYDWVVAKNCSQKYFSHVSHVRIPPREKEREKKKIID